MHTCRVTFPERWNRPMASGIEAFAKDFPESETGFVVHSGDVILPLGGRALALPMGLL